MINTIILIFYSYTCILRHLEQDITKYQKCPMCSCHLTITDLKSIQFEYMNEYKINDMIEFQLLHLSKQSLSPIVVTNNSLTDNSNSAVNATKKSNQIVLSDILSTEDTIDSKFSRVTYYTIDKLEERLEMEYLELLQLKQECIDSSNFIPTETENITTTIISRDNSNNVTTNNTNIWNQRKQINEIENIERFQIDSSTFSIINYDISIYADVEYIPFIELALTINEKKRLKFQESILKLTTYAMNKLKTKRIIRSNSENSNILIDEVSSNNEARNISDISIETKIEESFISNGNLNSIMETNTNEGNYFYQINNGNLIFLHILCYKCLQEQSKLHTLFNKLPEILKSKIIDIEKIKITKDLKNKLSYLRYLPEYCEIQIIEIDMKDIVELEVLNIYSNEFLKRLNRRNENIKKLQREKKHEEKVKYA